jgi:molybdopterin-containing oxidoreductase family iron-sulfur binding subunit
MHWLRIDSYFIGNLEGPTEPKVVHQPILCMHCETAPCELVCPVGATSHSVEGINEMTYNRCVGTRYCSNNCPYKVRRFNFFNWFKDGDPSFDLQHNPDVTVRVRGVMEKCNYCLQRVNRTRIEVEKMVVRLETPLQQVRTKLDAIETELERTRDEATKQQLQQEQRELNQRMAALRQQIDPQVARAEKATIEDLQTACQQACPTEAIVFGNKNDPESHVARLKSEPLDYPLLSELTTFPRTTYMARLRNPNQDLEPGAKV